MSETGLERLEDLLSEERWLRSLATGLVKGADRADEVVQETWLAAVRNPPGRRGSARGWLATVARNAARQLLRRERRIDHRQRAAARTEAVPDVAAAVARVEIRRRLADEVLLLSEPFRTAIVLRHFEGRSPAEIAEATGVPAATVRTRIHRGLAKLRDRLDRQGGRRAWTLALLPFLPNKAAPLVTAAGAAALIPGVLVMSAKLKAGVAVAVVLLLAAAAWQVSTVDRPDDPSPPVSPVVPALTPAAATDGPAEGEAGTGAEDAGRTSKRRREVLAENDRIEGSVRRPDGTPAPGIVIRSSFRGPFRVNHRSCHTVTGEKGEFSFPAVRGAPYSVSLVRAQPGLVGSEEGRFKEVRGGDTDVIFIVPDEPSISVVAVDAVTGEPVSIAGAQIWYTRDGRRRYTSLPPLAVTLANTPRVPASADAAFDAGGSRFTVGLPPASLVDPDTVLTLRMWTGEKGYEPAAFDIPRHRLSGHLGERTVSMRPFPDKGGSIRVLARYEDGEAFTGEARLYVERDGIQVMDASVAVIDGEGRREGLPLGADAVNVRIEGKTAGISPGPVAEGESSEVRIVLERRWELTIDPRFEGKPRRLEIRMSIGERRPFRHSIGSGSFPYKLHGNEPETRTLTFAADGEDFETMTVELVPGEKKVLRPRIPAGAETPAVPAPAPAAPRVADVETPVAEGPGVLTARIIVEGGGLPPPFPVHVARYADAADQPDLPSWFETTTAADGTFRLDGLPPGRYGVMLRPPGLPVKYARFEVLDGEVTPPLEIVFDVGGTLVVVIRGTAGEAIAGQEVGITPYGSGIGTSRAGLYTEKTDAAGRATFSRVVPGSWEVTWMPSGRERQVKKASVGAGETAEVVFDLAGTGSLEGRLLDPDGAALTGAIVRLWGVGYAERAQAETDALGRYSFEGVAAGEYRLSVQALGPKRFTAPVGRLRILAGDRKTMEIRLPDTRLAGRVVRADTGVALERDEVQLTVSRRIDDEHESAMTWITKDGRFEFIGLPPGKWTLHAIPMGIPLAWFEKEVELPLAGRIADLEVSIRPKDGD